MVNAGAGAWLIILTTFVVNLRHALYAATLAPYMRHLPHRWLAPMSFCLTDETFIVVIRRYRSPDASPFKHWYYAGTAVLMYVNWQLCTWIGLWAGRSIPNPRAWGLEFAIPVTFLGMLLPWIRGRAMIVCVLVAGAAALLFRTLPNQLGLLVAALAGVGAGVLTERLQPLSAQEPAAPDQREATQ
jgi:predicted branched-subunit amino acid permease